jgi:1-deoxy-D-xylulose-5-phosphate reductoisomerase
LAYEALHQGGNMPCIVNAANEVANRAFIDDKIGFEQIGDIIERTMGKIAFTTDSTLETYLQTDKEARQYASTLI